MPRDGEGSDAFDLAILYWFYRDPRSTRDHLELLRRHNPGRRIYGLFGGSDARRREFEPLLFDLLDDFWPYPGTYGDDEYTKWIHGDLLLLDWYEQRGELLAWDSIAVVQWDMLVFTDVGAVLPGLRPGQVFFSGDRPIDRDLELSWEWTEVGSRYRRDYLRFRRSLAAGYGWTAPLHACMYVYEVLTRAFLDGYRALPDKRVGMLEYKGPSLARVLGLDVHVADIGLYWDGRPAPLTTGPTGIPGAYIRSELARPDGWRMFHPYRRPWSSVSGPSPIPPSDRSGGGATPGRGAAGSDVTGREVTGEGVAGPG